MLLDDAMLCCSSVPPICNIVGIINNRLQCKKGDFLFKSATVTFASDWPTKTAWCEGWNRASHASRHAHLFFARSSCLRYYDEGDWISCRR